MGKNEAPTSSIKTRDNGFRLYDSASEEYVQGEDERRNLIVEETGGVMLLITQSNFTIINILVRHTQRVLEE